MRLKRDSSLTDSEQLMKVQERLRPIDLYDGIIRTIAEHGFRQIVPPPIQERRYEINDKNLKGFFENLPRTVLGSDRFYFPNTHALGLLRAYSEMLKERGPHVSKWFYLAPIMKDAQNRVETAHEIGAFVLGDESAMAYAQLINAAHQAFSHLGIEDATLEINTIGCSKCREEFSDILRSHLENTDSRLCEDCTENLDKDYNEVLNCAVEGCKQSILSAPQLIDFLDDACKKKFVGLLEALDELEIPYMLNPVLPGAFGNDSLTFQFSFPGMAKGAKVGIGGHLSHLVKRVLKEEFPVLGFLMHLEPLLGSAKREKNGRHAEVFVIPLGDLAARRALKIFTELRREGIKVQESMLGHSGIQDQLRAAQSYEPEIALIVGQKEAMEGTVILRDMRGGMQEIFTAERIIEEVKKRLGK